MSNAIQTTRGRVTAYGFACGYKEARTLPASNVRVEIYSEHGVYHVRAHHFGTTKRLAWETAENVTGARALYRALCQRYKESGQ